MKRLAILLALATAIAVLMRMTRDLPVCTSWLLIVGVILTSSTVILALQTSRERR